MEQGGSMLTEIINANDTSGVLCVYCDNAYHVAYTNKKMQEMLGYADSGAFLTAIDGIAVNAVHPEDLERLEADSDRLYPGMELDSIHRMPHRDGRWIWTVHKCSVIRLNDGRNLIIDVINTLPKFLNKQRKLQQQNELSTLMLSHIPGGYHRCTPEKGYPFLYTSERFREMLGWSERDIRVKFGNKFINLVHPEDRAALIDNLNKLLNDSSDIHDQVYRLAGRHGYRWVTDCTTLVKMDSHVFFQGTVSDLTDFINERTKNEQALSYALKTAESQNGIISSISKMFMQIYHIDLINGTYEEVSAEGSKYGSIGSRGTLNDMEKIGIELLCSPEYRETISEFMDFSTIEQRMMGKQTISEEILGNNGVWYSANFISEREDQFGRPTHLLYAIRNINDDKTKELEYKRQLIESTHQAKRANSAKTDFLRRMSHDIRTPINGIRGMLQIASRTPYDYQKQAECHEKIWKASGFLLDLVNSVLDMSKLESGEIKLEEKPFSLKELDDNLSSVSAIQAEEAGIHFVSTGVDSEHINLIGSEVHFRQIAQNLITNAIRYNKDGGYVKTGFREIMSNKDGVLIEFTCEDNGKGMTEEFQKHAYEPFSQETEKARTAYSGTGLGLSIAKKLVEFMDGNIKLESKLGKGTKFTVTIPFIIDYNKEKENHTVSEPTNYSIEGVHILLVEDNEMNMEIADFLLSEQGAVITKAWNGLEATDLFENSMPGEFDIILTDIMMPVMGGLEEAQYIRSLARDDAAIIPIVAMTANAFQDDIDRSLEAGMNAHVSKPLDINKLVEIIAKLT